MVGPAPPRRERGTIRSCTFARGSQSTRESHHHLETFDKHALGIREWTGKVVQNARAHAAALKTLASTGEPVAALLRRGGLACGLGGNACAGGPLKAKVFHIPRWPQVLNFREGTFHRFGLVHGRRLPFIFVCIVFLWKSSIASSSAAASATFRLHARHVGVGGSSPLQRRL